MKSIEDMMKAAQEAAASVQAQMQEAQAKLDRSGMKPRPDRPTFAISPSIRKAARVI